MKAILVVDDSPTMLQSIAMTLEKTGYKVVTAINGVDALDKLSGVEKYHVIITDVNMPEMDGITFTTKAREVPRYKFTPIIVVTTESELNKKTEGKYAGATGWIVKPFIPEQLVNVVRKVSP